MVSRVRILTVKDALKQREAELILQGKGVSHSVNELKEGVKLGIIGDWENRSEIVTNYGYGLGIL